jgi:hypothetical protein
VTFVVTLSYPAEADVTIDYTTLHLTTDDADFTPGSGQITIPAGATSGVITVWVNGDGDEEPDEQFILRIDRVDGPVVATVTEVHGLILSDDGNHLSPVAVAADAAGGLVYVALHTARRIAVVDAASEQFLRSIALPDCPTDCASTPAAAASMSPPADRMEKYMSSLPATASCWPRGRPATRRSRRCSLPTVPPCMSATASTTMCRSSMW